MTTPLIPGSPLQVPIPSIEQLTQNVARLLQQSLSEGAQAGDPASLSASDLELARSNIEALAFVQAAGLHGAYRYLRDFIARQAIPTASQGAFLDGWLLTYGMSRKPAAAATGTATGTGVDGSVLPAGSVLQADDGAQFVTTAAATVAGGVLTVDLLATQAGAAGNLASGQTLVAVSPVVGVDAEFVTDSPLDGGVDVEADDLATYRLQQRLAAEPRGGSPADYARWALQVPGITRAWGVRNPGGATTAGVLIMADGNASPGLPTLAQRDAVFDYIRDPLRGPPDELFVIIPTPVVVDVALNISPDTTDLRVAVSAAIRDLFFREAVPGGPIPHSHLTEVISAVVSEYNHTISSPTITSGAFFTVGAYNELLVAGDITFS